MKLGVMKRLPMKQKRHRIAVDDWMTPRLDSSLGEMELFLF